MNNLEKAKEFKERFNKNVEIAKECYGEIGFEEMLKFDEEHKEILKLTKDLKEKIESEGCKFSTDFINIFTGKIILLNCNGRGEEPLCPACQEAIKICEEINPSLPQTRK